MSRTEWMNWCGAVRQLLNWSPVPRCTTKICQPGWEKTKDKLLDSFVLVVSLAMRFVVLYTWVSEKRPQSVWLWKSEQPVFLGWLLASCLLEILRRSLSIHLSSCDREAADEISPECSCGHHQSSTTVQSETRRRVHRSAGSDCLWTRWACGPLCPPPQLSSFAWIILGCRRTTDCRTENHWETRASPGPEGGSGRGLPLAAPSAAPARPPGSSRVRWECESFPCGSSPSGQEQASCPGRPPGWRRGRRPSCSERMQRGGKIF